MSSPTYQTRSEPGRVIFIHNPGSGLPGSLGMFALSVILTELLFVPNWLGGLYLGIPIGLAVAALVFLRGREGKVIVVDQDAGEIRVDRGMALTRETHLIPFKEMDSLCLLNHRLGSLSMGWEVRLMTRRGEPVILNPPSLGILPFRAISEEDARLLAGKLAEAMGASWAFQDEGPGRIRLQPGA